MTKIREVKARTPRLWVGQHAVAIAFGVLIGAAGAHADEKSEQAQIKPALVRRLDADEVQAQILTSRLALAQSQAGVVRVADLFGESDEDKAARLQHEQGQDSSITQLGQRVNDLEDTLRRLTGQMEQLDHRLSDVNSRIERMQKDFDYKLCTMSAQQLGAPASGDSGGLPCNGASNQPTMSAPPGDRYETPAPENANGPVHLAPPPSVLGTIPSNTPLPLASPPNTQVASLAPSANRPQFDSAMNLLAKAQYDEARAAFRTYADSYPKDDLAPQAVYWVGDIAYVQKDYPNAARAFAEEIKKYGSSPRAPDSMLKLGQSLVAMNQKQEGCTTLGALQSKYPQASKAVLGQATAARKTAGCK